MHAATDPCEASGVLQSAEKDTIVHVGRRDLLMVCVHAAHQKLWASIAWAKVVVGRSVQRAWLRLVWFDISEEEKA